MELVNSSDHEMSSEEHGAPPVQKPLGRGANRSSKGSSTVMGRAADRSSKGSSTVMGRAADRSSKGSSTVMGRAESKKGRNILLFWFTEFHPFDPAILCSDSSWLIFSFIFTESSEEFSTMEKPAVRAVKKDRDLSPINEGTTSNLKKIPTAPIFFLRKIGFFLSLFKEISKFFPSKKLAFFISKKTFH